LIAVTEFRRVAVRCSMKPHRDRPSQRLISCLGR
jgi:hypothetical protein